MSGLELLPKAKAARPDVPVIMITAYGDAETKRKALENGAEALLTKPIDFAALRGEIETRLGLRGVTRAHPRRRRRAGPRGAGRAEIPPPDPRRRRQLPLRARRRRGARPCSTANRDIDMVVSDINMPRMDGLSLLQKLQEARGAAFDHHRLGLWRHGQHPHRDEPRRVRFPDQADRFRRSRDDDRQDAPASRSPARGAAAAGRRRSARTPRCRAISRPIWPSGWPAMSTGSTLPGSAARSPPCSPTSPASPRWSRRSSRAVLGALLNEYLAGMTDIVFAHDGTVAKIVGDALHVLFGAPGDQPDHAARAVACALALDAFVAIVPRALARQGHRARRDAHRRPCRAGDRRKFRRRPLLRLHRLWRHHQHRGAAGEPPTSSSARASASARARLHGSTDFRGRPVGDLMLRGRTEPLRAFEPLAARAV